MKSFVCFVLIVLTILLCLLTACSKEPNLVVPSPSGSAGKPNATSNSVPPVATPTPEPTPTTYIIGTVTALEDKDYAYVRFSKDANSDIVGAAALGVDFPILSQDGNWCEVIFVDELGYIESKYLTIKPERETMPNNEAFFYVPSKKETGLVNYRYNNKIVPKKVVYEEVKNGVKVQKERLDIYTTSGELLAQNASLVLTEATITAPALPSPSNPAEPTPTPTSTPSPTFTASNGGSDSDDGGSGTAPTDGGGETESPSQQKMLIESISTQSATPVPTTSQPIKIVVKNGKVTTCQGITLEKDSSIKIGKDYGHILAEDKTVLEYNSELIPNATITVQYGKIYTKNKTIELEPDYYLVPEPLIDNLVDVAQYSDGIEIDILFAKPNNIVSDEKVYDHEACLLQKGTLEKLKKAQELFAKDDYTIIIYDAYRPYSVTERLFERWKNSKYVAPLRFGSVHNKGAAVDMSLLDSSGNPLEMPSPIHTLNETSNRSSKAMTAKARQNMDYMADIMRKCGFTTIESEWWHFSDADCMMYLRTDHDMNKILRVIYETKR